MTTVQTISNTATSGEATLTDGYKLDNNQAQTVHGWVAIVENGFDTSIEVTPHFTTSDDPDFNKYVTNTEVAAVEVPQDDRRGFGDAYLSPYSYLRLEIKPRVNPTSGTVTVTWQDRSMGDT